MILLSAMLLSFIPHVTWQAEAWEEPYAPVQEPYAPVVDPDTAPDYIDYKGSIHVYAKSNTNVFRGIKEYKDWEEKIKSPIEKDAGTKLEELGYMHSIYSIGQLWRNSDGGWRITSDSTRSKEEGVLIDEDIDPINPDDVMEAYKTTMMDKYKDDKVISQSFLTALGKAEANEAAANKIKAQKDSMQSAVEQLESGLSQTVENGKDRLQNYKIELYATNWENPGTDSTKQQQKKIYDAIAAGKDLYINISPKDSTALLSEMFNLGMTDNGGIATDENGEVKNVTVEGIRNETTKDSDGKELDQYIITLTIPVKIPLMSELQGSFKDFDPQNDFMQNYLPVPQEGYGFPSASVVTVEDYKKSYELGTSKEAKSNGAAFMWLNKRGENPEGALTPDKTAGKMAFGLLGTNPHFQTDFLGVYDITIGYEREDYTWFWDGNWSAHDERLAAFDGLYNKNAIPEAKTTNFLHVDGYHQAIPYENTFYTSHSNGYMANEKDIASTTHHGGLTSLRGENQDTSFSLGTGNSFQNGGASGMYIDWNISAEVFVKEPNKPSVVKYFYDKVDSVKSEHGYLDTLSSIESIQDQPSNAKLEPVNGTIYRANGTEDGYYLDSALVLVNGLIEGVLDVSNKQVIYRCNKALKDNEKSHTYLVGYGSFSV